LEAGQAKRATGMKRRKGRKGGFNNKINQPRGDKESQTGKRGNRVSKKRGTGNENRVIKK